MEWLPLEERGEKFMVRDFETEVSERQQKGESIRTPKDNTSNV